MQNELPDLFIEPFPPIINSMDIKTRQWLQRSPHMWQLALRTVDMFTPSNKPFSMRLIIEMMRYIASVGGLRNCKIPNSYAPYLCRLLVAWKPDLATFLSNRTKSVPVLHDEFGVLDD